MTEIWIDAQLSPALAAWINRNYEEVAVYRNPSELSCDYERVALPAVPLASQLRMRR